MRKLVYSYNLLVCLLFATPLDATIFGRIRGIVHDPQHRPLAGASIKLQAVTSDWSQTAQSDDNGEFLFTTVPVGDYRIAVTQSKFEIAEQTVTVVSGSSPILHFQLAIAALNQSTRSSPLYACVLPQSLFPHVNVSCQAAATKSGGVLPIGLYTRATLRSRVLVSRTKLD
jgi:hypothetical protein